MVLSLGIAVVCFSRIQVAGAQAFLFGNLAAFFYALGSLLEIHATTPENLLTSLTLEYIGISTLGPLLLLTALTSTRGDRALPPGQGFLLFIIPAITVLAVATNSLHHLFYTSLEVQRNGPFTIPVMGRGPFYMISVVYLNVTLLWGVLVLLMAALRAQGAQRRPFGVLFLASLLPWTGMALYLSGLSPWGLDVAPFGLALSGSIFAVGLFRFRLFDLTPLVTDQVFENMREAVLVVDLKDRLVGFNPALNVILPQVDSREVGTPLTSLSITDLRTGKDLTLEVKEKRRTYQIDRSALKDRKGRLQGEIFILTDITVREELSQKLARMARLDELTELPNRRAFMERLQSEADRLHRYGTAFSLGIADIDHFKEVNDTWGHEAGDAALVHVARLWSARLRTSDFLARYGGEEFIFLLAETQPEEAKLLLERLRQGLEDHPLVWRQQTIPITASFGVATADESASVLEGWEAWFRKADLALYRAKEGGRNRVECAAE